MKKKIIVLIVRRHAGEVDWILPLLYKYKKSYKIITIFSDELSFNSLKNNKDIFNIWKTVCNNYFIISFKDQIIWKFIHKILLKISFGSTRNTYFYRSLEKTVLKRTFSLNNFLKKFKIKIKEIKILFVPNVHLSYLPSIFKNFNSKIFIVRFPEATMISANKLENPKINTSTFKNVDGDIFLFSTRSNKEFFFGKKNSKFYEKKIVYCGFLRYEKWWIKKLITSNKKKKLFTILVALRSPNMLYFQKSSYMEAINSIMLLTKKFSNCRIIFKVHPQEENIQILQNILMKFNKNSWLIKKNHMINLANQSNLCISILTSACFDALAVKVPTLEYYNVSKEIALSKYAKNSYHMVYDQHEKKWVTIFNYKGLVDTVDSYKKLETKVSKLYYKKKLITWKKNFDAFSKLTKFKNNTNNIFLKINKRQKSTN